MGANSTLSLQIRHSNVTAKQIATHATGTAEDSTQRVQVIASPPPRDTLSCTKSRQFPTWLRYKIITNMAGDDSQPSSPAGRRSMASPGGRRKFGAAQDADPETPGKAEPTPAKPSYREHLERSKAAMGEVLQRATGKSDPRRSSNPGLAACCCASSC